MSSGCGTATADATIGAITASMFAWPVADLIVAPYLIAEAMRRPVSTDVKPAAEREVNSLRSLLSGERARLCFLAGGPQEHREALACAASEGRPTARVSLREATAAHSMQMTLIDQLYKPLGAPVFTCLGAYWLSLFDMLISDHAHTRHRDFCVVLGQLRRALRGHAPSTPAQPRPLLIIEHMYVPTGASGACETPRASRPPAVPPAPPTFRDASRQGPHINSNPASSSDGPK